MGTEINKSYYFPVSESLHVKIDPIRRLTVSVRMYEVMETPCPECSYEEVPKEANFCPICGYKFEGAAPKEEKHVID